MAAVEALVDADAEERAGRMVTDLAALLSPVRCLAVRALLWVGGCCDIVAGKVAVADTGRRAAAAADTAVPVGKAAAVAGYMRVRPAAADILASLR